MSGPGASRDRQCDDELIDAIIALCLAGVGVHAQQQAITAELERGREPQARRVIERLHAGLRDVPSPRQIAGARARLSVRDVEVLVPGSDGYPPRLRNAWPELGAPLWIFRTQPAAWYATRGRPDPLQTNPAVAVVGTRHPTADGMRVAAALASSLAEAGAVVISGMARGIDQEAHGAALQAGGYTAAVLGTGHGVDYPRSSHSMLDAVSASAGLFSELLPGTPPRPHHFLARNRIISGLADITVVVEGRARSGALHTARMAAAQGRDVWAAPGSVNAPASQAPLALIRDGASVMTHVDDIAEALGLTPGAAGRLPLAAAVPPAAVPPAPTGRLPAAEAEILQLLGTVPTSVDELVHRTGHPVAEIMAIIGRLRRLGLASSEPSGVVAAPVASGAHGRGFAG